MDRYYRTADEVLGIPLSTLCWEGSRDDLQRTEITQPAVFLTSVVLLDLLRERGAQPGAAAGHSLGEYAALVTAGVLDWTDALRLVRRRGELMAAVNERTPGAMIAVIGLAADTVSALCADVAQRTGAVVAVANYNEPHQQVVAGEREPVREVAALARARGAERVAPLPVGAPFHCALMSGIEAEFAAELTAVTFAEPRIPVYANVTGAPIGSGAEARDCLRRQLAGPVRWTDTLDALAAAGIGEFVEVGPGRVLTGFCRATLPELTCHPTGDLRRFERSADALAGELAT